MLENIRLSFQGIWSHKMRSFLTMLGIIIGIGSIISIVSTIKGTNEMIKQNLIGSGNNAVYIYLKQGDQNYEMDAGAPSGITTVTDDQKKQISELNMVENASYFLSRSYADNIYYNDMALSSGKIMGIDLNYLDTCGLVLAAGRGFVEYDYTNFNKAAILDDVAASSLFEDVNPIGQTIEIGDEPFTIVGLVQESTAFEPTINTVEEYYQYNQGSTGTVYITSAAWPIVYNYDEPQNCVVKADSTDNMSTAGGKVADILNASVKNSDSDIKYKSNDVMEQAKNLQQLSNSTNQQLLWIASISLLVGGIGVMNIMLVTVTERTNEIGLKKAIGARKNRILWQFLTEAAVLTSIGGVLGVIMGIILAQVIYRISGTPVAISVPAIIGSVAFSMAIGIIFGLLPSIKAANLNPIDALRRE